MYVNVVRDALQVPFVVVVGGAVVPMPLVVVTVVKRVDLQPVLRRK